MKYSAMAPYGVLRYTGRQSPIKRLFLAMRAAQGGGQNYSIDWDSEQSIRLYCMARCLVQFSRACERAGNNANPLKATEGLPDLEAEYRVIPRVTDTWAERRAAVAAKMLVSKGARRENVIRALTLILGDDFVAYHPIKDPDAQVSPATLAASPGSFKTPATPIKQRTLTTPISIGLGSPQAVATSYFAGSTEDFLPGETVTVEPGRLGCMETVEVESVSATLGTFTATFNLAHGAGSICSTAGHPLQTSTYRHNLIVVSSDVVTDAETRKKINDLLRRILRAVSTWTICDENVTPGQVGPFRVGHTPQQADDGMIGITPIGTITL